MKGEELHRNIIVLSGKVGEGKSSFLSQIWNEVREEVKVAGFIAKGEFSGDQRSGFTLLDLQRGRTRKLASREAADTWIQHASFFFDPAAFREGMHWLEEGIKSKASLLVIDEVGPLELQGGGWNKLLSVLGKDYGRLQLWVVRETCLEDVLRIWKISRASVYRPGTGTKKEIVQKIRKYVRNYEGRQNP